MVADPLVSDVIHRLTVAFQPLRIILFGSRARGDAHVDSDLDLLVVMPDGVDHHDVAVAMRRALADLPLSKDLIVTTPTEIQRRNGAMSSVLTSAIREGVVLHERD